MPPPFLTIDPRTSPISLSPFPSPKISPKSETDDLRPRQSDDDLVSPLTPNDYSRLSGFPQLSNFDFAFDDRSSLDNPPSPSGPRRPSDATSVEQLIRPASVTQNSSSLPSTTAPAVAPAALPQLSIVVPSNAVAGGVHRPAATTVEGAEAPPPYSRYAGASQAPVAAGSGWGGVAARVAGAQNAPPMVPIAIYTRGHQRFASAAGVPINGNPRRQSGQRGLHALALADQSQQPPGGKFNRQDTWREKITAGYWETEVEVETGSENKKLTRKGRRCIFAATGLVILVIVIVAIVVGVVTSRKNKHDSDKHNSDKHDASNDTANAETWFPDLPKGAHILKPQGRLEKLNTCVSPSSLWSCDLPSDSLFPTTVSPSNLSALPEFRFTINIRNKTESGSDPNTQWISIPEKTPNATDYASVAEKDGVQAYPKSGEETKYYISMITQDSSSVDQEPDQTADHAPSPVTSTKPSRTPEINVSSEPPRLRFKRQDPPAPAKNMLPETVKNQPLLFFDRGMDTEHYGFHMYYAKTIRVTSTTDPASSDPAGGLSSNVEAGTDVKWERTRFKVVIWTKKRSDGRVELIDPQGNRVQASVNVDGLPYAVSIVQDRYGDRGAITYGSGLPKAIQEKFGEEGRCLCEWRNWRAKS